MAISIDFHLNNPNALRIHSHVLTYKDEPSTVVVTIGKGDGYGFQSASLYCQMEQLDELIQAMQEAKEKLSAATKEENQ